MSNDDPWSPDQKETLKGYTFWIRPSRIQKLKSMSEAAPDSGKILAKIKTAIEKEIDDLYEKRPKE